MSAPTLIYVPRDAAALAMDADAVAAAIELAADERGLAVQVVRNGSRGLLWLEPLVEIATPQGRLAYGPVQPEDVPALFDAGWLTGGAHPLGLGLTEEIPYLKQQERLTFARVGVIDPLSLQDYAAHGGLQGLKRALAMEPAAIVEEMVTSGLRGRGGAAFPTGIKWKTVLGSPADRKYIVCNADEGDSGTFADRLLMEGDPYVLIEGMTIAGLAVDATYGYIYVRSEYPHAIATLEAAIERARDVGWLGDDVHGSGRRFDLEVRKGAGAYICGEETSLLESIEGKRGVVRAKPPLPAIAGLFGKPTVINNVISLATVPIILAKGAAYYRDYGVGRSHGTLPFQLAGNLKQGGLVEKAFGLSLRDLLYTFGGGSASRPATARGAGRRPAGRLPAGIAVGRAAGLRSLCPDLGHDRPRRPGGVRRQRRHGAHGALCDGVLRHRVLWQVHALSHRLDPWRGDHRQDHRRRPGARTAGAPAARPVRHHAGRIAVRPGGHGALPGAVRAEPLPAGLRHRVRAVRRPPRLNPRPPC